MAEMQDTKNYETLHRRQGIMWHTRAAIVITNKSRASGQQIGPGPTDRKLLTVN
jgi:hypothetical protein